MGHGNNIDLRPVLVVQKHGDNNYCFLGCGIVFTFLYVSFLSWAQLLGRDIVRLGRDIDFRWSVVLLGQGACLSCHSLWTGVRDYANDQAFVGSDFLSDSSSGPVRKTYQQGPIGFPGLVPVFLSASGLAFVFGSWISSDL